MIKQFEAFIYYANICLTGLIVLATSIKMYFSYGVVFVALDPCPDIRDYDYFEKMLKLFFNFSSDFCNPVDFITVI